MATACVKAEIRHGEDYENLRALEIGRTFCVMKLGVWANHT